jgi:glutamate N-acetyltransferase/amino-acid N-acetyltransferase
MTAPEQDGNGTGTLLPIPGMRLATAAVGAEYRDRPDLLLATFEPGTRIAGVLTRSSTAAAPVRWSRARLAEGAAPRALVVSAGNANCFTGSQGEAAVERTAELVAEMTGCEPTDVYIASTGRIGQQLEMAKYETALRDAHARLETNDWSEAARAIMTTDRFPKSVIRRFDGDGGGVTLEGISKGSTMIAPHMATTLSFLFSDASLPDGDGQELLQRATERTYNRISVDNTQSTNDTILLFYRAGDDAPTVAPDRFERELQGLLHELSQMILEDGRGDGVLIAVNVDGAEDEQAAARIARTVADSYLVRRDVERRRELMPGRIIAAIGMAEEKLSLEQLTLSLGDQVVGQAGAVVGPAIIDPGPLIRENRFNITVDAGVGDGSASVYTVVA